MDTPAFRIYFQKFLTYLDENGIKHHHLEALKDSSHSRKNNPEGKFTRSTIERAIEAIAEVRSENKKYLDRGKAMEYLDSLIDAAKIEFKIAYVNEEFQPFVNSHLSNNKPDYIEYFVCYYWYESYEVWDESNLEKERRQEVDMGYLELKKFTGDDKKTYYTSTLKLFPLPSRNEKSTSTHDNLDDDGALATIDSDDITWLGNSLIIRMTDKINKLVKSQWTIWLGDDTNFRESKDNFFLGTYCSVIRSSRSLSHMGVPLAGSVVLERKKTKQEAIDLIAKNPRVINNVIHNILYRTRLTTFPKTFQSIDNLPKFEEVNLINNYKGIYEGINIQNSSIGNYIEIFTCRIFDNNNAELRVKDYNNESEITHKGRIRIMTGHLNSVIAYFDFIPKNKVYRITMYFGTTIERSISKFGSLFGVYSKIERHSNAPRMGRIVLNRIDEDPTNQGEFNAHYEQKARNIYENDTKNVKIIPKKILEFLSGNDTIHDYLDILNTHHLTTNTAQKYEGTYYTYCISSNQNKILKYPLKIDENGIARMKGDKEERSGVAQYDGHTRLSLYFNSPRLFHLLFKVNQINPNENFFAFGVSSKLSVENEYPIAKTEILYWTKDDFDDEETRYKEFKISFEENSEFLEEDRKVKGLLAYLTGRFKYFFTSENPKRFPEKEPSETNAYFHSACYLATKKDYKNSLIDLYQSYLNGFRDSKLLNEEISPEGSLFPLYNDKNNDKPLTVKPRFSDLEELSFEQIIEKINQRITNASY